MKVKFLILLLYHSWKPHANSVRAGKTVRNNTCGVLTGTTASISGKGKHFGRNRFFNSRQML
jgi:hypothetical protein